MLTALLPTLLSLAPTVVDLVMGDKSGAVAKKVIGVASDVLGLPEAKRTEQGVADALAGLPPEKRADLQLALAQLATDERKAQREADLAEMRANIENTVNARAQTIELAKLGHAMAWAPAIVSMIVLVTFGIVLYMVLTAKIPAGQERIVDTMIGILGTLAVTTVAYWVGSSSGSARKDALLAQAPPIK